MRPGSRAPAFTFPEAVVTTALLVLLAGLVGTVWFQGQSLATRLDTQTKGLQQKTTLAHYLTALCDEVRPPEWANPASTFEEGAGVLSASYWKGVAEQRLKIETLDGLLTVVSPEGSWSWKGLASLRSEFWKRDGRVVGLALRWREGTQEKTLHVLWGGRPL